MTAKKNAAPKGAVRGGRGREKKYEPPVPRDRIDAMICGVFAHRYALLGVEGYELLPHEAAIEIEALLRLVREGPPTSKKSRRPPHLALKARVAYELMITLRLRRSDALRAAYGEPDADLSRMKEIDKLFQRALPAISSDRPDAIEGVQTPAPDPEFDAAFWRAIEGSPVAQAAYKRNVRASPGKK